MTKTEWKEVPGYDGKYRISNLGEIESSYWDYWKSHSIGDNGKGYKTTLLSRNTKVKCFYVHRLVLEVFAGPPNGREAAHLDGVRSNNQIDNLRWVTKKENESHKIIHGTLTKGSRNGCAKLSEQDVLKIRAELADLKPYQHRGIKNIAKKYGLNREYVHSIRRRDVWKHI